MTERIPKCPTHPQKEAKGLYDIYYSCQGVRGDLVRQSVAACEICVGTVGYEFVKVAEVQFRVSPMAPRGVRRKVENG